jgi:hypothetical protein
MTVLSLIFILVLIPAAIGFFLYMEVLEGSGNGSSVGIGNLNLRNFFHKGWEPGDFLIYRKAKVSNHPGPRARNVQPSDKGDDYYYEVDKYWSLADVLEDGRLVAVTRRGKQVYLTPEDEKLRKARLLERLIHRRRFPSVAEARH